LENELVLHCLKQLFDSILKDTAKASMDAVVQQWLTYPKQCYMKSYMAEFPRLLFRDGISTITDISAGTKMGILFTFVIAAQTNDGHKAFLQYERNASEYEDMIQVFEMLLCYWAWLKRKSTGTAMTLKLCILLNKQYGF